MKKQTLIILLTIVSILIIIAVGWIIIDKKENERIDAEAVTLKENLQIEYGKKAKASDFIENLNGTMVNDTEIDTNKLGKIEVQFEFINIKNKKRTATFYIETKDVTAPKIFSGSSYTVKKGYNKQLENVLMSGDDIDDTPTRKIVGEYDFNTAGDYNLTYVVTDASGNETKKDFVLHVVEPSNNNTTPVEKEKKNIEDIINTYKNEKTKIGIDVSKWQGEIDWQKVKESGIEFAIIRMGYQKDYDADFAIDPYFEQNMEGAKNAGIPVGLYFYSYAKTTAQAEEQANWVKEQIKNYKIDLPIAFDWESWSSFNKANMSFNTINKVADTFMKTISNNGDYAGMLYSSKNYLEKIWYPTEFKTWLAHYTSKTNYTGDYYIWQMCDTGKIDGINADVDIDIMYLN